MSHLKNYVIKTTHKYNIFNGHIISCCKITPKRFGVKLFFLENNNLLLSSLMTSDSILKKDFRSLTVFDLKTIMCAYYL